MAGANYARDPKPDNPAGRWPANLIHDGSEEVLALFPESRAGLPRDERGRGGIWSPSADGIPAGPQYGDSGSAARFFYCAKASRADRDDGLRDGGRANAAPRGNHHSTVKPTELMRYLCRLVTPPGGTVLDPFAGSGSTGRGAVLEGFNFIGIEREPEYAAIAERRIAAVAGLF